MAPNSFRLFHVILPPGATWTGAQGGQGLRSHWSKPFAETRLELQHLFWVCTARGADVRVRGPFRDHSLPSYVRAENSSLFSPTLLVGWEKVGLPPLPSPLFFDN